MPALLPLSLPQVTQTLPSRTLQGGSPEVPAYPPELCRVLVYVGTVELSELGVLAVARSAVSFRPHPCTGESEVPAYPPELYRVLVCWAWAEARGRD